MRNSVYLVGDLLFNYGDYVYQKIVIDNRYREIATNVYTIANQTVETFDKKAMTNKAATLPETLRMIERVKLAADRIRESNPEYKTLRETEGYTRHGCYVATCVYGSYDCPEVWTLRRYRDNTLAESWYGRAFIRVYYALSPTLVKWFGETKWFKKMWQGKLDRMVKKLNGQGVENTPYQDKQW